MARERRDPESVAAGDGERTPSSSSSEYREVVLLLREIVTELKKMNNRSRANRGFDIGHNIKPKGL